MTYIVRWSAGGHTVVVDTYDEAQEIIYERYPDAEIGHSGDLSDGGDRTLAWATEEDSVDDDGARSCAEITRRD